MTRRVTFHKPIACFRFYVLLLGLLAAYPITAQTQLDLKTQSKSVNFEGALSTKPLKSRSILPATCSTNEVILLTSAPAGSNIYVCVSTGNWAPQGVSGTLTVQNGGNNIGARQTQNFVPGNGMLNVVTDLGNKINIEQAVDTSLVVSKAALQNGGVLLCKGASETAPVYSCAMSPALSGYSVGMVVNWVPSTGGAGAGNSLNIDLLGPVPLVRADGVTGAGAADIATGQLYQLWYDGAAFRLPSTTVGGSGSSAPPAVITSTNAGGATTLTATTEWHSPLASCAGATSPVLDWDTPPSGAGPAVAGGCGGSGLNDAYASFAATGTPSLQSSFILPKNLTGKADVSLYYVTSTAGGTFTPTLDVVCTPVDGSASNDGTFTAGTFLAPGAIVSPLLTGSLSVVAATGLTWPSSCLGGTRAHLRLMRTDTGGTANAMNITEVVITMRRLL